MPIHRQSRFSVRFYVQPLFWYSIAFSVFEMHYRQDYCAFVIK
uniref:Uncharacterized protein n=1 Tax=Rhizophora mucronata TaxID=61149 RepID=A0A2P2J0K2_RHIMU